MPSFLVKALGSIFYFILDKLFGRLSSAWKSRQALDAQKRTIDEATKTYAEVLVKPELTAEERIKAFDEYNKKTSRLK